MQTGGMPGKKQGDVAWMSSRQVGQSWDCSQVEYELEERHAMDWLEDDEMMKQWEEVSKEEEKTMMKRNEGRVLRMNRVLSVP